MRKCIALVTALVAGTAAVAIVFVVTGIVLIVKVVFYALPIFIALFVGRYMGWW